VSERIPSTDKDALDDGGKLYRCENCDWPLNIDRDGDSFGGPDERAANFSVVAEPLLFVSPTLPLINIIKGSKQTLRELDASGDEKIIYYTRKLQVAGCPLCGTRANTR
jgi:hypothetical protein